jgi:hypothetical protein
MFKLPLHTARRGFNQPVTVFNGYLHSSAATDRTMCVNQAVNGLQTAQSTTAAGRIVNKLSMRLANDRATTRTEQLIWLAKVRVPNVRTACETYTDFVHHPLVRS